MKKSAKVLRMTRSNLWNSRHISGWVFLLAWILAVLSRTLWPTADPPIDLSWSGGYMADEGFWVHDARSLHLTGEYSSDQWHNRIVSPLVHPPMQLLFKLSGASLLTVRIWAMLLAMVSLFLFDRISRRIDPTGMLFLLYAINSLLIAYQRIAILESAVIPVALLTMWIWLKARDRRQPHYLDLLTGICAALVWLVKSTQIYFIPVVLVATFLSEVNARRKWTAILFQLTGITLTAGVWLVFIRLPHGELLIQYNAYYLSQQGADIGDLLKNIVMNPSGVYFSALPVLFTAALIVSIRLALNWKFRLVPPGITFAWTWLMTGLVFFSFLGYRPMRYYLPLTIPIIILGCRAIMTPDSYRGSRWSRWLPIGVASGFALTGLPFVIDGLFTNGSLLGIPLVPGFPVYAPLMSLILLIPVARVTSFSEHGNTAKLKVILLVILGVFHIGVFSTRLVQRRYDIPETSREMAEMLPADSVIAGQWAPELVLDNSLVAVPVWRGFVNDETPFSTYGITHLIAWEYALGNELDYHREWFPEIMRHANQIASFSIKDSTLSLWEIVGDDGADKVSEND